MKSKKLKWTHWSKLPKDNPHFAINSMLEKAFNKDQCIVKSTITERSRIYGEPHLSHENIGLSWTGLIQQHYQIRLDHPLPSWLVEQMMAAFKIHRSARVFHADNYVDARAYLRFAEHGQQHPNEPFTNE